MAIETVEDIIEEILDVAGIYGAHGDIEDPNSLATECPSQLRRMCRVCASSALRDRFDRAYKVEYILREHAKAQSR